MTPGAGGQGWSLERVVWLTPYAADGIAQEARRAGAGARLDVILPGSAGRDGVGAVEALFGWLREKGVEVVVRLDVEG